MAFNPTIDTLESFMDSLKSRTPGEHEFHQAVHEVAETVIPFIKENPEYAKHAILDRLTDPDRVIIFRVTWEDDKGDIQNNRGYRIQYSNAIGPYKGGLRFHPSVNLGLLKFLAFEQVFKNSLTTLPMGGGKGGSDFDPKGKSDAEVMRFCQAFMTELRRHIGQFTDVPAGDIGVGGREIGFLYGQYKRLQNEFTGTLTGKGRNYGGSLIRPEATGYGTVYFLLEMLKTRNIDITGKSVTISGSGNVAQYAAEKCIQLGAKVLTLSDSSGCIVAKDGITAEQLAWIIELKEVRRGRIQEAAKEFGFEYLAAQRPWGVKCDIALPCATQNELELADAQALLSNNCFAVAEGANMPSSPEAVEAFQSAKILYAPGKASNAGGVATSGLEMSQNSLRISWTREEVDAHLQQIMKDIHTQCVENGTEDEYINYVKGANIAGFKKVADTMIAFGIL